jgi:hypothetical protein
MAKDPFKRIYTTLAEVRIANPVAMASAIPWISFSYSIY